MSDSKDILEHLFVKGEFPARAKLLSGLTLEQVTQRPDGASHSIYDELWHAATYQRMVVDQNVTDGDHFPSAAPEHEQQWLDIVQLFHDGARAAVEWSESPERLAMEVEPNVTMADELHCLAIHNAYHLGKIVALRQRIGAWPPNTEAGAGADGS